MIIIESMLVGHDIPGTVALGDAIHGKNNIKEQGAVENNTDDYSCWNSL